MPKKIKDDKIYHLDMIMFNYLSKKNIIINGWRLELQRISNEILWRKGDYEVLSTPFWEDDSTWIIILSIGNKYDIIEEIDVWQQSYEIKTGGMSVYKFIEYYLNTMKEKLLCIELQEKLTF